MDKKIGTNLEIKRKRSPYGPTKLYGLPVLLNNKIIFKKYIWQKRSEKLMTKNSTPAPQHCVCGLL